MSKARKALIGVLAVIGAAAIVLGLVRLIRTHGEKGRPKVSPSASRAVETAGASAPSQPAGPALPQASLAALPPSVKRDRQTLAKWNVGNNFQFLWESVGRPRDPQAVFEVTIPGGHDLFTLAVNDNAGVRVRNLVSMGNVAAHGGKSGSVGSQTVKVAWNGRNDAGELVPPGVYRLEGLSLPPLQAKLDYVFYNPGDPPWQGYAASGWGGDHSGATGLACVPAGSTSRWRVVITWPVVESPHATIALDKDLRKVWGYKRVAGFDGAKVVAIHDGLLWMGIKNTLLAMELDTGKVKSWQTPKGPRGFLDLKKPIDGLAVGSAYAACLSVGPAKKPASVVTFLDRKKGPDPTGALPAAQIAMAQLTTAIAVAPDGVLYASTKTGVVTVDPKGAVTPVALRSLQAPGAIAFDPKGNLYVMDLGADFQVKVYSPGRTLLRTIGARGGQRIAFGEYMWNYPRNGRKEKGLVYDPAALHGAESMAIDEFGRLWIAEGGVHPRRVAVWDKEGKFVRDFVGCTVYSAGNSSLHKQDPTRAFSCGVEFKVDPSQVHSYRPVRYLSSGMRKDGPEKQRLNVEARKQPFVESEMFRGDASGRMREYFITMYSSFPVLYMERNGDYQVVAAIATGSQSNGVFSKPGLPGDTLYVWSDVNADALVQGEEVQALPRGDGRLGAFYAWNCVLQPDLVFYLNGQALAPADFTAGGAPIYDGTKARALKTDGLFVRAGKHLVGMSRCDPFAIGVYRFADLDGNLVATYPLPAWGVHASPHAQVPAPGQTSGELYFTGTADMGDPLGSVVATQGNMGQMFMFTEDGLFISSLFSDTRVNPLGWPDKLKKGLDVTRCTMWAEPFGAWFGRQDDGKVRVLFGRNEGIVCRVVGLERVRRMAPMRFRFTSGRDGESASRRSSGGDAVLRIPRVPSRGPGAIALGAGAAGWRDVPARAIRVGGQTMGIIRAAHDGRNLYLAWRVNDASPLKNKAQDERAYFKEGDCVDLMLGPHRRVKGGPVRGDLRLLLVPTRPKPSAVLYRAVVPGTKGPDRVKFTSPILTTAFDSVRPFPEAKVAFRTASGGYMCTANVPLKSLGIEYTPGLKLLGDLGVLFSDAGGQSTNSRAYLFCRGTMTADVAEEARLQPREWGTFLLE